MHLLSRPILALIILAPVLSGGEAGSSLEFENPGFEAGTSPAGWSIDGAPSSGEGIAAVDGAVARSGGRSLRVQHDGPARTTLRSTPVRLEVGRLYRLSGWLRTRDVRADPTARYPTAVPAALSMASFPFTNTSMPVGGTREWTRSEAVFIATGASDRVVLGLGVNGAATGTAWFDDLRLEEVTDPGALIPVETVRWHGPAYRYTDKGWTFLHIEGEPYPRGYAHGILLAKEIASYIDKLAVQADGDDPGRGWGGIRKLADALFLRGYDEEYLVEMQGIADGAAKGGAAFRGRPLDLLDIATINSVTDIVMLPEALSNTATPLGGRSFRKDEEEAAMPERLHKCSSFIANGAATRDGRIVFSQLFMWGGYTGVHWTVIADVAPSKGHRLVYETFPGGIHSGADFYLNDAGIMIGETTTLQTPFDPAGKPQSSRIRKAAQYASSIDDVEEILAARNNGLYTNDWVIGDAKTDETAVLLLGTKARKLWRSSRKEFPGDTDGFYWSVNNAKDPEVRKEFVPDPSNAPFDVVFGAWNRDIAFREYYRREKGRIDAPSAVRAIATSPINRPHACDGKVSTSEMAERLVFLGHHGKVTLREKFPEKGSRRMPDLPGAVPHLTLGYSAFSPIVLTEMLKASRPAPAPATPPAPRIDTGSAGSAFSFDRKALWINTVYPAGDGDNWFPSGTAAYWQMLSGLPADPGAAHGALREGFAELCCRLNYVIAREGPLAPSKAIRRYDGYKTYQIPRIRGTYLLHQLRLALGNETFLRAMHDIHERYREKPMATAALTRAFSEIAGQDVGPIVAQWVDRDDLPSPTVTGSAAEAGGKWTVALDVVQRGEPYRFWTTVTVEAAGSMKLEVIEVRRERERFEFTAEERPLRVTFNAGFDIPVPLEWSFTGANLFDDFSKAAIVYGTSRQVEANRTIALRYQSAIADAFTEDLLPVRQDNGLSDEDLAAADLVLLGNGGDNEALRRVAERLGLEVGTNLFRWRGRTYADPEDGLFLAAPNPFAPARAVYIFVANSALELHQMTKAHRSLPVWAVWKGEEVVERGYLHPRVLVVEFGEEVKRREI